MNNSIVVLALIVAAAAAGCAAAAPGFSPPNSKYNRFKASVPTGGGISNDGHYVLNDQEEKLDCKKINGIIHIGILQLRESGHRHQPSAVAKAAQQVSSPVVPGSTYGMDPDAERAYALARLRALNSRLAAKKCATFDLEAALAPGNTDVPTPVKADKAR